MKCRVAPDVLYINISPTFQQETNHIVFPSFDCNWCGIVLNVSPRAEVLELA